FTISPVKRNSGGAIRVSAGINNFENPRWFKTFAIDEQRGILGFHTFEGFDNSGHVSFTTEIEGQREIHSFLKKFIPSARKNGSKVVSNIGRGCLVETSEL